MGNITKQQNKMLHAIFTDIAKGLNEEGITLQEFIKDSFDMYADQDNIKNIFKQLSSKAYGISSTQELSTKQINTLLDVMINKCGKFGVTIELPDE